MASKIKMMMVWLVAMSLGCAPSPSAQREESTERSSAPQEECVLSVSDPWSAATEWIEGSERGDSKEVRLLQGWASPVIARMWHEGNDETFVLVAAAPDPGQGDDVVVLHLRRSEDASWEVVAVEKGDATALWPEL